uniref:Uncharacterized protein n=1 Tax=Panagrellus redivivus TaxID=6233 RepID=A0A7E4WDF9_PANRE
MVLNHNVVCLRAAKPVVMTALLPQGHDSLLKKRNTQIVILISSQWCPWGEAIEDCPRGTTAIRTSEQEPRILYAVWRQGMCSPNMFEGRACPFMQTVPISAYRAIIPASLSWSRVHQ